MSDLPSGVIVNPGLNTIAGASRCPNIVVRLRTRSKLHRRRPLSAALRFFEHAVSSDTDSTLRGFRKTPLSSEERDLTAGCYTARKRLVATAAECQPTLGGKVTNGDTRGHCITTVFSLDEPSALHTRLAGRSLATR